MLFVFKKSDHYAFWMKDTPIPLTIIFLNSDKQIVDIHKASPYSKKIFTSSKPFLYALELHQDAVEEKNIQKGDFVKFNL